MRILALWLTEYYSGNGDQFFKTALKNIGAEVDIVPLDLGSVEKRVLEKLKSQKYDFLFHIPYKSSMRSEVMRYITDTYDVTTIGWQGDDEWLWDSNEYHNPKNIAHDYHFNVTTSQRALSKYLEIGYQNVILGQWGYSKFDWKIKKVKKDLDVYFCGASTPERDEFLRCLLDEGFSVDIDGPGYGLHSKKLKKYDGESCGKPVAGKVPLEVMIERYSRAKIALNFNLGVKQNKPYTQIKARTFEIPAVKTFQLAYACPEVSRFFEPGKEIEQFSTKEELINKVRFYLKNEAKREEIALFGHLRNKKYSYENILKRVFKEAVKN